MLAAIRVDVGAVLVFDDVGTDTGLVKRVEGQFTGTRQNRWFEVHWPSLHGSVSDGNINLGPTALFVDQQGGT